MIGLAGKLPAHGDFVRRGGPVAVLLALDRWLDVELARLAGASEQIDRLDGWRFAIRVEEQEVLGVLIASEDAVGRRFPVIATRAVPDGSGLGREEAERWAGAAAQVMAECRDNGARAGDLLEALDAIARSPAQAAVPAAGWWRGREEPVLAEPRLPTDTEFARLIGEDGQ